MSFRSFQDYLHFWKWSLFYDEKISVFRFWVNWWRLAICVLNCCQAPAGPMINIFSLTTLVRLHSLYNFAADHIEITAPYNSFIVFYIFVSTDMYFNKSLPRERVYRAVAPLSFYTDGILNTYHRNVVCLLVGSGPTMEWSFLWSPFWGTVAGQRWCFLFSPFRGCYRNSRLWWLRTVQEALPPQCGFVRSKTTYPSKSHYDRRPVGQSILVSRPVWVPWPDINFCLTFTVLSMSGAPSDERLVLSSYQQRRDRFWGPTQAPIQWVPGALCQGVKKIESLFVCLLAPKIRYKLGHPAQPGSMVARTGEPETRLLTFPRVERGGAANMA
jgi:hypothetical protein